MSNLLRTALMLAVAAETPEPIDDRSESVTFNYTINSNATFTLRGVEHTVSVRLSNRQDFGIRVGLVFPTLQARAAAVEAWQQVSVELNGSVRAVVLNGYWSRASDSVIITGLPSVPPNSGTIKITSTEWPAVQDLPAQYAFVATLINTTSNANGAFGNIRFRVDHGGNEFDIRHIFTHNNGFQLRPGSLALCRAFRAANILVDTGIPGQQPFLSSVMEIVESIEAVQYRAFTGRYVPGTRYTVRLSVSTANPPTGLAATPGSDNVVLRWTAATAVTGVTVDGYDIRYKKASDSAWTTLALNTSTARRIDELDASTAYNFQVRTSASVGADSDWVSIDASTTAPAPTSLLSETLNAVAIGGSGAAGRFGGLTWTFTHSGRTYVITHCFTHGNGIQLRFSRTADAQAFIDAGLTVDSGIAGQSTFKSSVMSYDAARAWAQYAAFPGRYTAGDSYTVTISE